MKPGELPQLTQFLGGWFHQDWTDDGSSSPKEVVREYAQQETPHAVRQSIEEIERLLAARLTPAQLRQLVVDQLGCAYDPTVDGKTFRGWLREVHGILQKSQSKK